jgi:hypothetical protein
MKSAEVPEKVVIFHKKERKLGDSLYLSDGKLGIKKELYQIGRQPMRDARTWPSKNVK